MDLLDHLAALHLLDGVADLDALQAVHSGVAEGVDHDDTAREHVVGLLEALQRAAAVAGLLAALREGADEVDRDVGHADAERDLVVEGLPLEVGARDADLGGVPDSYGLQIISTSTKVWAWEDQHIVPVHTLD